ncbi:MAG: monofunctional biosynthetic peptidoglycan transglycosylase [Hyphomonadaceae bacterium]|nr:monofunctional biosynthetic peptidoglycan transglycosylase [Hyphomonadaceae bacterium]
MSSQEPPPREPPPQQQKPSDGYLAKGFHDLRARAKRPARRSWLMRALAAMVVVTVIIPVLWVILYGIVEAPGTLLMAQRAAEGETIRRDVTPISKMSPHLVRAVIAAEDARFCAHNGFDVEAIEQAVKYNERAKKRGSEKRRGASTISQQTAKNLFLWPARSWVRKGLEVYFTFLIEAIWPKRRIMEAYLNAAEWGDGVFGAEAAAQARFGKSAADLTAQEASRLAAVLPSPNKWNPVSPGPYVRGRARAIVARASVVRSEGLASCVLGKDRPPARSGGRKAPPPKELPTLPAPPPELAPPEEGAPLDASAPMPEGPSGEGVEDGDPAGEALPELPLDAPVLSEDIAPAPDAPPAEPPPPP